MVQLSTLQTLMVESRQLENDLQGIARRTACDESRHRVATISEIEDRIAAIDYQLNDPEVQYVA